MPTKQRHSSKKEIHAAAVTLAKPNASKIAKKEAAGILALIPRSGAKHPKSHKKTGR